jgi:hypothetical protein
MLYVYIFYLKDAKYRKIKIELLTYIAFTPLRHNIQKRKIKDNIRKNITNWFVVQGHDSAYPHFSNLDARQRVS